MPSKEQPKGGMSHTGSISLSLFHLPKVRWPSAFLSLLCISRPGIRIANIFYSAFFIFWILVLGSAGLNNMLPICQTTGLPRTATEAESHPQAHPTACPSQDRTPTVDVDSTLSGNLVNCMEGMYRKHTLTLCTDEEFLKLTKTTLMKLLPQLLLMDYSCIENS